jgi:hypothetical protein
MPEDESIDAITGNNRAPTTQAVPETFWIPDTLNYVPGSASELEQKLKRSGIKQAQERTAHERPK